MFKIKEQAGAAGTLYVITLDDDIMKLPIEEFYDSVIEEILHLFEDDAYILEYVQTPANPALVFGGIIYFRSLKDERLFRILWC